MTVRKIGDTTGNPSRQPRLFTAIPPHAREDRTICGIRASCNGLYDITITDALNTPRINLFLAAIQPSQSADFQSFPQSRATMEKWNADSPAGPSTTLCAPIWHRWSRLRSIDYGNR
jgi:hypothetical protein